MLSAAGHEVGVLTRSASRQEQLRAAGAEPVSCDALDAAAGRLRFHAEHFPLVEVDSAYLRCRPSGRYPAATPATGPHTAKEQMT
jgi:hypothetical protein